MSANIEFPEELPAAIPNASNATSKRLFLDATDGSLKTKDFAGTVATVAVGGWTHNANVTAAMSPYAASIQESVKVVLDGLTTVVLPTANSMAGQQIKVISLSDLITPPVCTISTTGGDTINGLATYTLTSPRERVTVESDGSDWLVVD